MTPCSDVIDLFAGEHSLFASHSDSEEIMIVCDELLRRVTFAPPFERGSTFTVRLGVDEWHWCFYLRV
jgi:hypothetical protein